MIATKKEKKVTTSEEKENTAEKERKQLGDQATYM